LAVAPRNGWASHRPGRWLLLVVGFLVSVLCGALAYWDAARRIALKSAEQELRAQKEKLAKKSSLLETTLENMAQGIAVYDADYNLVSFSERFSTIFGFPPGFLHQGMGIDEMVRQRHKQGHYKEDIDEIIGRRRQALALMSERSGERTLPNGTVVAYHRQPMPGGGCVTTHTDITDRKRNEEALAEMSALLKTTFENMSQGVSVYDADLKLAAFNHQIIDLMDFPPGFLRLGMPYEDIARFKAERGDYGPGDVDEYVRKRVLNRRERKPNRKERTWSHGKVTLMRRNVLPDGGYVSTHTDITRERRFEEDLRHAKEQAESANQSKSEFLALMSHELRTPLNSIIGFSELMMKGSFGPIGNEKYLEFSENVNASGHHLLALINDILDISKAEAGKFEMNEEEFDPAKVIQSCLRLLEGQAGEQGVELVEDIPNDMPYLRADERMLKQITLNLLSNAIKFTPEGGKVTLKMWSQPGTGHVLQVIDTGIGVALNDIPKILKPFIQIENALSRKHQGTGLGLPLCKSLIELHGGYLDFQSKLGVGSTVTIRFPKERVVSAEGSTTNTPLAKAPLKIQASR
ncbi:MAG: PAS-domain containing protein, partial [Alphaproteobacteria bacterium]|nr:PAS-domain containing protein [Alphaproteobacteria bacterium]